MGKISRSQSADASARPRRRPVQDRSKATVTRLLDALGEYVTEHGFRSLNTNAIAAKAGVGVATLYAYFPDILAMLEAYADRSLAVWLDIWRRYPSFEPVDDWKNAYRRTFKITLAHARKDYAYVLIMNAYGLVPDFDECLQRIRQAHVSAAVEIYEHAGVDLPLERMVAVARTVIDAGWATVRHAARSDDEMLVEEYERLIISYMANYLPDDRSEG